MRGRRRALVPHRRFGLADDVVFKTVGQSEISLAGVFRGLRRQASVTKSFDVRRLDARRKQFRTPCEARARESDSAGNRGEIRDKRTPVHNTFSGLLN